jgi:hypothetical protein
LISIIVIKSSNGEKRIVGGIGANIGKKPVCRSFSDAIFCS